MTHLRHLTPSWATQTLNIEEHKNFVAELQYTAKHCLQKTCDVLQGIFSNMTSFNCEFWTLGCQAFNNITQRRSPEFVELSATRLRPRSGSNRCNSKRFGIVIPCERVRSSHQVIKSSFETTTGYPPHALLDEITRRAEDEVIPEEQEILQRITLKNPGDKGRNIVGGPLDALVIHATQSQQHDLMYREAFLMTYRTFISPLKLIRKLEKRHQQFAHSADMVRQRAARNTFLLLLQVVDELTVAEFDDEMEQELLQFKIKLDHGEHLALARSLLVSKIAEKKVAKQTQLVQSKLWSLGVTTRPVCLLSFNSRHIAEQLTLLDAQLFAEIEISEMLTWARDQTQECPTLTKFTKHFNAVSYWAHTIILRHRLEHEARETEKYIKKFLQIISHLKQLNNFSSYLALVSALESAPIHRLQWRKSVSEDVSRFSMLIDSSRSFQTYRQVLAKAQPPCVPYIGLVLQDLTFVHLGHENLWCDGSINFSKRWQQFGIIEKLKKFKNCTYQFKEDETIMGFFNGFSDVLCEEAMWQISESIVPRRK